MYHGSWHAVSYIAIARIDHRFAKRGVAAKPGGSVERGLSQKLAVFVAHEPDLLEKLTGADMSKLFPIPDISNKKFPEARALEEQGLHRIMYRWSPQDFSQVSQVWNGPHPEDGSELIVEDGIPAGATPPDLPAEPQLTSPGIDMGFEEEVSKRLGMK